MRFYSILKRLEKYTGVLVAPGLYFTFTSVAHDSTNIQFQQVNCHDRITIRLSDVADIIPDEKNVVITLVSGETLKCIQVQHPNLQRFKQTKIGYEFLSNLFDTSLRISVLFQDCNIHLHQSFTSWKYDCEDNDNEVVSFYSDDIESYDSALKITVSSLVDLTLVEDTPSHTVVCGGLEDHQFGSVMLIFYKSEESKSVPTSMQEYLDSFLSE